MLPVRFALRRGRQVGVLDQVPDLRHETVRMNVDGLHSTTADGQLTTLAWGDADLKRREPATRKPAGDEDSGRRARDILEEVSTIRHVPLRT